MMRPAIPFKLAFVIFFAVVGLSRAARATDIGILTWPDGYAVIVAGFLTASAASPAERNAFFAELAQDTAQALGSGSGSAAASR